MIALILWAIVAVGAAYIWALVHEAGRELDTAIDTWEAGK